MTFVPLFSIEIFFFFTFIQFRIQWHNLSICTGAPTGVTPENKSSFSLPTHVWIYGVSLRSTASEAGPTEMSCSTIWFQLIYTFESRNGSREIKKKAQCDLYSVIRWSHISGKHFILHRITMERLIISIFVHDLKPWTRAARAAGVK